MKKLPLNLLTASFITATITLSSLVSANAVEPSDPSLHNQSTSIQTVTTDTVSRINKAHRRLVMNTIPYIREEHPDDAHSVYKPTMVVSFALIASSLAATATRYRRSC